jgi:hypothetical protein
MKILRRSRCVRVESYALDFEWKDASGAGFSFPCDRQGKVLMDQMSPIACESLQKCLSGEYGVVPLGVKDYSHTYFEYAIGQCSCGREVMLRHFTNTCECDLEYNSCGQLLAPRSQWEEPWVY